MKGRAIGPQEWLGTTRTESKRTPPRVAGVEGAEKYGRDFCKLRDFSEQLLWGQACYTGHHFIPKTAL